MLEVDAQPGNELGCQVTIACHLRRLHCHIQCKLVALLGEHFGRNVKDSAVDFAGQRAVCLARLLPVINLLDHPLLQILPEFPDQRLPERINLDGLHVGQEEGDAIGAFLDFLANEKLLEKGTLL